MADFVVDLNGYRENVSSRIEPGRYRLVVEDADSGKSNAGGEMVTVWLRVVGGENDGATIVDRFPLTDAQGKPSGGLFRVVGFMQALGLPTPKKRLRLNTNMFLNRYVDGDVIDNEYKGRVNSTVETYLRAPQSASSGVDDLEDALEQDAADDTTDTVEDLGEIDRTAAVPDPEPQRAPAKKAPAPVTLPEEVDLDMLDL